MSRGGGNSKPYSAAIDLKVNQCSFSTDLILVRVVEMALCLHERRSNTSAQVPWSDTGSGSSALHSGCPLYTYCVSN